MLIEQRDVSITDQTPVQYQAGNVKGSTANHDGSRLSFRSGKSQVISSNGFTDIKHHNGKRVGGTAPTAVGGRIPQQPVFVPAGKILTPLSSGC